MEVKRVMRMWDGDEATMGPLMTPCLPLSR